METVAIYTIFVSVFSYMIKPEANRQQTGKPLQMTAINPLSVLSQLADNEPAATHTYIIDGTQQTDTYTAGELTKYLLYPEVIAFRDGNTFTTGQAVTVLVNANIF